MNVKMGNRGTVYTVPCTGEKPPEWETVEEFCSWWNEANRPIAPPDEIVYCSDDATALCLFRHGQFQVELYMIHPSPNLPVHAHPDVDVIKMRLDTYGWDASGKLQPKTYAEAAPTLVSGDTHGQGINFKNISAIPAGFGLLAFSKWKDGLTLNTVAARWRGPTVGPMQEALIRELTPGAIVSDGFADTTGAG